MTSWLSDFGRVVVMVVVGSAIAFAVFYLVDVEGRCMNCYGELRRGETRCPRCRAWRRGP